MKKIYLLFCLAYVCAGGYAQVTIVKGADNRSVPRPLTFFSVNEGGKAVYASTRLDNENGFAFAIPHCEEGFYYISDTMKREFIRIYLKKGENLDITLKDNGMYQVNAGSPENKLMAEWRQMTAGIEKATTLFSDTTTYRSFFPAYEALMPKANGFKKKIVTTNAKFNRMMKAAIDFDMDRWAVTFLLIPHSAQPAKSEYPDFYKTIASKDLFASTTVLKNGDAVDFMPIFITFKMWLMNEMPKTQLSRIEQIKQSLSSITNDTLKGIYLANTFKSYKSYEDLTNVAETFQQYLLTPMSKEKYFNALRSLSTFKKGTPGYNFQYPDTKGTQVSLKSLKGKVVVVDIWATWCSPCKAEIPHLQKLEEEMKDNPNVAFVSISVDEEKDKQKWMDFVKEKSLGGIQLYAQGWSDLTQFYNINGIPRFMVFDQNGNIISIDAPRPSSPELKQMINTALTADKTAATGN
jgi:thiol-disulfide isomerase/thioredoxin